MRSRIVSLALLYVKSTFSLSLPTRKELKKPKTLFKTIGIGIGILFLIADISVIFVMMNLSMYNGLKPAGMQGLMLLNAATTASILVFVLAFMLALSMFSMSGIESGFLVLPFTARELLAAKMFLVYVSEALAGIFLLAIAMAIYGIKESPSFLFYINGILTAMILPLAPTAISYLILIPMMNASKRFRNKNFILYVGGFLGMLFALGFNFYIQSMTAKAMNPSQLALLANPDSLVSRIGQSWIPSWLAWKALADASKLSGVLAVLANLAIGLGCCVAVVALLGKPYVKSLQAFNESTFSRRKLPGSSMAGGSIFARKPLMRALVAREIKLMNREPMYLLNGPFVVILMPLILAIVFVAQKNALSGAMKDLAPLVAGPGGYLIPAGFGAFLGSSTSIACTAVSRDAKALSWMKALPVAPLRYFLAKLIHAELFSVFGGLVGCVAGGILLGIGGLDLLLGFGLALLFATVFNMGGLWLETAFPRLRWDNPIAAMKQNPNAVIAILGAMGLLGGMAFLAFQISLPRYAYAAAFAVLFAVPMVLWVMFYPRYAARRYGEMEG
jgi:ABC-2 type transport system permease protein